MNSYACGAKRRLGTLTVSFVLAGCANSADRGDDGGSSFGDTTGGDADSTSDPGSTTTTTGTEATTADDETSGSSDETGAPIFDVGGGETETGGRVDLCKVQDDGDAVGACEQQAPPDSFEPDVQWSWWGPEPETNVTVVPLVANLTDDNDDGEIDLCDTPDVVVIASEDVCCGPTPAHVFVLDGQTGAELAQFSDVVNRTTNPAIGDIDGDGLVEVVATSPTGNLVAFEHDGTKKFDKPVTWPTNLYNQLYASSLALADVDNDGDVEILGGGFLTDHDGNQLWTIPNSDAIWTLSEGARIWQSPTMADLDDDGDLELVFGHSAYHHDGTELFHNASVAPGFPQIADLDGDGRPEILMTNYNGLAVLEHDGVVKYKDLTPTGDPIGALNWMRPATIHDFDGDGQVEFAMSSRYSYTVYEADASIHWTAQVLDATGLASGTAFDFLGDATAEAMYGDETQLFVFDDMGAPQLTSTRTSNTAIEYPTVADVDNDGSAEIVVVSNVGNPPSQTPSPSVQVIRDVEDRWIQARRIWNQHTYHVTNVREDGTIPTFEPAHWELLNTFRTNAQIEGGAVCDPAG